MDTSKITAIVPSYNTLEHTKNTYKSLKDHAPNVNIILIDDASEDGTKEWLEGLQDDKVTKIISDVRKGHTFWYDEGMRRSSTEIVSILHSDMIIGKNYFENMVKHLEPGTVVCATRVEPPIHPAGKEKIVKDFGDEADTFNWDAFNEFVEKEIKDQEDEVTRGIFAPWTLYRADHFEVGGHDQTFAPYGYEDSDIFNRWINNGYTMIQARDSLVYHMTCRGHRWNKGVNIENPDYQATMDKNAREFLRKWGDWIRNDDYQFPVIYPKYNKGVVIKNATLNIIHAVEPWFDTLYVDCDYSQYIKQEQQRTIVDLESKFKGFDDKKVNDILVGFDTQKFKPQDGFYLQNISAILYQNKPDGGKFEVDNLTITVKEYKEEFLK